jgi:hypothetical protein
MSEVEREGRTVVFVSHDPDAISRLCREVIWLDGGRIQRRGAADDVIGAYLASAVGNPAVSTGGRAASDQVVQLDRAAVLDEQGQHREVFRRGQTLNLELRFRVLERLPGLDASVYLHNRRGVKVLDEAWSDTDLHRCDAPGEYRLTVQVPPVLNVGEYLVGVWIGTAYETCLEEAPVVAFQVVGDPRNRPDRVIELNLPWQLEHSEH